jgi:hypothetical protein
MSMMRSPAPEPGDVDETVLVHALAQLVGSETEFAPVIGRACYPQPSMRFHRSPVLQGLLSIAIYWCPGSSTPVNWTLTGH